MTHLVRFTLLLVLGFSQAANIARRAQGTATVSLSVASGTPTKLGSGFIYGIPDNGSSISTAIPDRFYTEMGFRASRAGGAQLSAPSRGWAFGASEYVGRFQSALSNYRTTRKYEGDFILLPHDLWGADGLQPDQTIYPGDNGNWTSFEQFTDRLIFDMKANNMLEGVIIDIWNEPDISGFWGRSYDQYLEYWNRAFRKLRNQLPQQRLTGPSLAGAPSLDNTHWTNWARNVAQNGVIPDIYSWHGLYAAADPQRDLATFNTLRGNAGLPERPIHLNEYGAPEEQIPSATAWFLSRFERLNIRGLRANWASGAALHDYLGNLLGKSGTRYYPNGEWHVYKYYAAMGGQRVATSGSSDFGFDVFAVKGNSPTSVKVLAGNRRNTNTYDITIEGLTSVGLPTSGTVRIRTYRFDWNGQMGEVSGPVDLGVVSHAYSNDVVTFWVSPATINTAYAFEFV